MNKLEKAKEIIKENIKDAEYGIFSSRNIVGDRMTPLYVDDELHIDICYSFGYYEVFGLNRSEFKELVEFYNKLISND